MLNIHSKKKFPSAHGSKYSNCSDGDVRLIGGKTEYEGTLLLCINNAWGTVCQTNGWNDVEAQIACNNLGYKSQGATHYITNLGNLFYPIFTRDFNCTLSESLLCNCSHISNSDDTHCGTHYYDVGLKCEGKYLSSILKVLHLHARSLRLMAS